MSLKKNIGIAALLLVAVASQHSFAVCNSDLEVVGTTSATIRTFDENGKRVDEIDKSLAVKQRAVDCNESLGLIKVVLTNNRTVWINRSEAKRTGGVAQTAPVCVAAVSDDPSRVVAATNGVDPALTKCTNPVSR
jgi:hypothetical protein